MKRFFLLIITVSLLTTYSIGQKNKIPKWIVGTWYNPAESNKENFETFIFSTNKITYIKGFPYSYIKTDYIKKIPLSKNKFDLLEKYKKYKTKTFIKGNLFQINFSNTKESVSYEFRLQKVDYFNEPVLSYSIIINGKIKREHLMGCQFLLIRK